MWFFFLHLNTASNIYSTNKSNFQQTYWNILLIFILKYFSQKTGFDISCKLSQKEKICLKCQILFSGKIKRNTHITNLPSAEFAQRVIKSWWWFMWWKQYLFLNFLAKTLTNEVLSSKLFGILTLKTPKKPASENAVCLCCLLNILKNFSNLFLHTGKQCEPRSDCS